MEARPGSRTVPGLALACHPLPTLAVTAFATACTLALGADVSSAGGLAIAVFVGQLSVGWANDALDSPLDVAAGRTAKPVVGGLVSPGTVWSAARSALALAVVCSFLLLPVPAAALHVVAVASAWAYDVGLKGTPFSPLPYVVSFALLPVVVRDVAAGSVPGPWGLVVAAGLLGAAAHFANTVGDARADAATGVRGLPQRAGPTASLRVAAGLVLAAALVLLATGGSTPSPVSVGLLALAVTTAAASAFLRLGVEGGPTAFRLSLLAVALVVAGFVTGLH